MLMVIIKIRRGPRIIFAWGPIKAWAGPDALHLNITDTFHQTSFNLVVVDCLLMCAHTVERAIRNFVKPSQHRVVICISMHVLCMLWITIMRFVPVGCWRNRSGLHRVHRGHQQDACVSPVGHPLLRHALLPGAVHHVWEHGGSGGAAAGSWHLPQTLAQRSPHRSQKNFSFRHCNTNI